MIATELRTSQVVVTDAAERPHPVQQDPFLLWRCPAPVGFHGPRRGRSGFCRRSVACGCVYHARELQLVDDVWLAPCGHSWSTYGAVPLTDRTAVRTFAKGTDVQRWRTVLARHVDRMTPERRAGLTPESLQAVLPVSLAAGAFWALTQATDADRAAAFVLALVENVREVA